MNPQLLNAFCSLLEANTGISLDLSKEYLIKARLEPLARANGFTDCEKLLCKLVSYPLEPLHWRAFEAMATHETFFFRDGYPFEMLSDTLLPALIAAKKASKQLNIWCAAASTGQEPYSLAMLLQAFEEQLQGWSIKILATDISSASLDVGRRGLYSAQETSRGLKKEQLNHFFTQTKDGAYQMSQKIMSLVEFRTLNLMAPWLPLPKFDLILLRNVLIYFNRTHRDFILKKIQQQLSCDKSYLMLGSSESILSNDNFQPVRVGRGLVVYQRSAY